MFQHPSVDQTSLEDSFVLRETEAGEPVVTHPFVRHLTKEGGLCACERERERLKSGDYCVNFSYYNIGIVDDHIILKFSSYLVFDQIPI